MSDFYCDEALSGKTPITRVFESENVLAFHHTNPYWEEHVVVVPKKHIGSLLTISSDEQPILLELIATIQSIAKEMSERRGACRVLTNIGDYQDSKHLHFHVCYGDTIRPPVR